MCLPKALKRKLLDSTKARRTQSVNPRPLFGMEDLPPGGWSWCNVHLRGACGWDFRINAIVIAIIATTIVIIMII